jgi:hypothetical protein
MDAARNLNFGLFQGNASETETPGRLFDRQVLQIISTALSLITLSAGFSIFGILIIIKQNEAGLLDLSDGGYLVAVGGVGAILVGAAFLLVAYFHWKSITGPARKIPARSSTTETPGVQSWREPEPTCWAER